MPLESKQQADLVRHREFNALRRLMVQRGKAEALPVDQSASKQTLNFASTQAIEKIDALEAQMNQQLFEHSKSQTISDAGGFQLTQVQSFDREAKTTQSLTAQPEEPSTVQQAGEQFANGKLQIAQTLLEQAIGGRGQQHDRVPTWLVLFDLYRASDQVDRFEALALDFSIRFGRSPPSWISIPQQAAIAEREHEGGSIQGSDRTEWKASAALTQSDVHVLEAAVEAATKAQRQLVLDWQAFVGTDAEQWRLLTSALLYLATQPIHCRVRGVAELEQLFDSESAESWLARLALLRCQNRAQAFEDLAIDYSVQFEISPPDWVRPECRFELAGGQDAPDATAPELNNLPPELYGTLDAGRAVKLLAALVPTDGMVIRCDRLVRCDPIATLAIGRFAQAAKAQGLQLELQSVHRVLAAYFAMQNLYDYAKITLRRD
jgi:hypothetical protein